jgi:hypothetical protein
MRTSLFEQVAKIPLSTRFDSVLLPAYTLSMKDVKRKERKEIPDD